MRNPMITLSFITADLFLAQSQGKMQRAKVKTANCGKKDTLWALFLILNDFIRRASVTHVTLLRI
jgi:hypothetical protein